MRDFPQGQAVLKLLGFIALLPLAAVNLYVVVFGAASVLDPGYFGTWPGWLMVLAGITGLLLQGVLAMIARDAPRGAGIALGIIGAVVLFVGSTTALDELLPAGWLALLAPFPSSVLFMMAGWWEDRAQSAG